MLLSSSSSSKSQVFLFEGEADTSDVKPTFQHAPAHLQLALFELEKMHNQTKNDYYILKCYMLRLLSDMPILFNSGVVLPVQRS